MRGLLMVLLLPLMAGASHLVSGVRGSDATHSAQYDDRHLIVCFRPGVTLSADRTSRLQGRPVANEVLRQLRSEAFLAAVERLAPVLSPEEPMMTDHEARVPRRAQSVAEMASLLHRYGQDRTVLLQFSRPIDPPRLARALIRRYPELIEFAEPDYIRRLSVDPNDRLFNLQWHLRRRTANPENRSDIRAPEAWDVTVGSRDVVIAVIDSGLDVTHPDIANKVFVNAGEIPDNGVDDDGNGFIDDVSGWDFARNDNLPNDENGHGTWMSGIAGAETNNDLDVAGVSWESPILPLKAGNANGLVFSSFEIEAINYAISMVPQGVRVINMSFAGPGRSRGVERALDAANEAGIVAIAAAGNGGSDFVGDDNDDSANYPSNYSVDLDNVVAVAATDRSDRLSRFSNFGKETVDVGSPGEGIFGLTTRDTSAELGRSNGVLSGAGTSPATAIVSGVAALIYSEFPELTPAEVKMRLRGSVDRLETLLHTTASGGRVNAYRSLEHDDIPPAPITDLRVKEDSSPVSLTWSATGDDGTEGQAALYDIRFLTARITSSNLRFTQKVTDVPFPQPAGTTETVAVPAGLLPRRYYFLIRVYDNVGNMVESNQVEVLISG